MLSLVYANCDEEEDIYMVSKVLSANYLLIEVRRGGIYLYSQHSGSLK
jgi:hypothetical protein